MTAAPVPPAAPEQDEFDVQIQRAKRFLGKNTRLPVNELFTGTIVPLLELMRGEYLDALDDLEERVGEGDEDDGQEMIDEAKELIFIMAGMLDNLFARLAWVKDGKVTSEAPAEFAAAWADVQARVPEWMAAYKEDWASSEEPVPVLVPAPAPVPEPVDAEAVNE